MSDADQPEKKDAESAAAEHGDVDFEQQGDFLPRAPTRKPIRKYDSGEPLQFRKEAVAQFLATPRELRPSKAVLANFLRVSRMTLHRWSQDPDVLRRSEYFLRLNIAAGRFIARREWPAIVDAQVRSGLKGNLRSAMFCQDVAWRSKDHPIYLWSDSEIQGGGHHTANLVTPNDALDPESIPTTKENAPPLEKNDANS